MVEAGQTAPGFSLPSHAGERVSLSDFRGSRHIVLSVYPAAFTPG